MCGSLPWLFLVNVCSFFSYSFRCLNTYSVDCIEMYVVYLASLGLGAFEIEPFFSLLLNDLSFSGITNCSSSIASSLASDFIYFLEDGRSILSFLAGSLAVTEVSGSPL